LKVDHQAEWDYWKSQVDHVKGVVDKIPGVQSGYVPREITNHVPRLWVRWDEKSFNFSQEDCFKAMQEGEPSIVPLRTPMGITIVTWMLAPGEEKVVAQRLKEVLEKAKPTADLRPRRRDSELTAPYGMDNPIDEWDPAGDGLVRQPGGAPLE
jgi:L-seryl-tRNA(Ser) seleniumtransferase